MNRTASRKSGQSFLKLAFLKLAFLKLGLLGAVLCLCSGFAMAQGRLAVVGGTVVNVRDGSLLANATVVIEGDRIVSVSAGAAPPQGATVVNAQGKYVLPGLIDLHVHYMDWAPELYLNHGVTTAVDLGRASTWMLAQREGVLQGTIPGPRLFIAARFEGERTPREELFARTALERVYADQISGGALVGTVAAGNHIVKNAAEARAAMRDYVSGKIKVDAIKAIHSLNAESVRAIVEEAKKANIPVLGHFANARLATDAGADGLEHTWAVAVNIVDADARRAAMQKATKGFIPPAESFMDMQKVPDIVRYMVQRGVYLNPTFRMSWAGTEALLAKGFHHQDFDLLLGEWGLRYVPLDWKLADLKEYFEIDLWNRNDLTPYDRDLFEQGYRNTQELVKAFADAGGKLYAGTDCAQFCVPGLGLHQEMELFVDAGVSPLKTLQAATINSAELMRMQDRLGTLEAGKAADVLILDANPLQDIRNTRKIAAVISRGRLLDMKYHGDFRNPVPIDQDEPSSHYFPTPRIRQADLQRTGGSGGTLTVRGAGFIPYSLVKFNGQDVATEFVDQFELRVAVPAELLKPGTFPVTVENPNFGTVQIQGLARLGQEAPFDHVSNTVQVVISPGK